MLSASTAPLRVLVAEDEPAMLSLVTRHLKIQGFSVVEASEGDTAWRLAQEHVPDLVILDVMMPGMSGWEVCRRIKSEASEGKTFSRTGVIMLTGIGENLNDMTSPLFSADAWLNKPFEFGELDERVRETLQRYDRKLPEAAPYDDGEAEDAEPVAEPTQGASARKASAKKKSPARKAGAKKAGAKKAGAKKAPTRKASAKKAPARRAPARGSAKKKARGK
ncbi:MAG TPA: response regulator [Candidatus Nanopelagicales bacterium]|nr:response regulator [Candidatus Nanopelagicales bacterium]